MNQSESPNNGDRLYRVIGEVLEISPDSLSEESSPKTVPTWDSLNHLNLVMALESEFGINLSIEDVTAMLKVGFIRNKLRNHGVDL